MEERAGCSFWKTRAENAAGKSPYFKGFSPPFSLNSQFNENIPDNKRGEYSVAWNLYPHNQNAYEAAEAMLQREGCAAIVHPTGTGKSFIAFRLAEEHAEARICWLSPSRYLFALQKENWKRENPDSHADRITFLTYARLAANRDRVEHLRPDYVILDEFHRCGAAQWGSGVKALLKCWPQAKVLGLSATSIRYLDEQRDMAEELFGGRVASEMTLGEAVAQGILRAPCYVLSVYSWEKELESYAGRIARLSDESRRKRAKRQWEKLRRALEQADGLETIFFRYLKPNGKYLVFCSGRKHLKKIERQAREWFGRVDSEYRLYSVYAKKAQNAEEFCRFQEDRGKHLKLLLCIDMLNEGIHVKDIDGVILLRPTVSPVVYRQQIGRALSAGKPNGKEGEEERPLILDLVNNFQNLQSFGSIEEEYQQAMAWRMAECQNTDGEEDEDGREGSRDNKTAGIPEKGFVIYDETREAGLLFQELQKQLERSWDDYYQEAVRYRERCGNLQVPVHFQTEEGVPLGSWLLTQRRIYAGKVPGKLSGEQKKKLEELGIGWESCFERQWETAYAQAVKYYKTNGNLDVKTGYVTETGFRLGLWLNNLRRYRTNGSRLLTDWRGRQLEQIGMIWDKLSYHWERGYAAAKAYYERYGNLNVPADFQTEDGVWLGHWILTQRQNRKGSNPKALPLTKEQIARLELIGMSWEGNREERWEACYQEAARYRKEKGTLAMPAGFLTEEGIPLGRWLWRQRTTLGKRLAEGNLTEKETERLERLRKLGMTWESDGWTEKWELACRYYEREGNLDIPQNYVTQEGVWLGKWLYRQRDRYQKERSATQKAGEDTPKDWLTTEQKKCLESIGMDWRPPSERAWENAYAKANAYYKTNGHLRVERGYTTEDGFRLDLWLNRQRESRREGNRKTLSEEREEKLTQIGMEWELR